MAREVVGLVLGAGGILGTAHAGVISVLHEAGIAPDLVVGASVGAMFGLGVAADLPVEYLARIAHDATPWQMTRFYTGRLKPSRTNPIGRMLIAAGEGKTFADLPLPFAVRTTDMATQRPTIIDSGPVLPAVQASIALPFIARPVGLGERYYVDGGFFDTAPVSAARAMGATRVIAVCLGFNYLAPRFLRRRPWTQPVLERWGRQRSPVRGGIRDQALFSCRLFANSFEQPIPGEDADIAIWPDFQGWSPNSMFGAAFCFDQGVKAAREALPAIERMLRESDAAPLERAAGE